MSKLFINTRVSGKDVSHLPSKQHDSSSKSEALLRFNTMVCFCSSLEAEFKPKDSENEEDSSDDEEGDEEEADTHGTSSEELGDLIDETPVKVNVQIINTGTSY